MVRLVLVSFVSNAPSAQWREHERTYVDTPHDPYSLPSRAQNGQN